MAHYKAVVRLKKRYAVRRLLCHARRCRFQQRAVGRILSYGQREFIDTFARGSDHVRISSELESASEMDFLVYKQ